MGSDESDHSREAAARVHPGDTILVHAGVYKDNRFVYSGFDKTIAAYGTPFGGTYYLTQSGTPDKPIVIKGAGDGAAVFDGDGNDNLFNLMGGNYNDNDVYNTDDESFDFSLKPGSVAVDAGVELPTITDDFTGKAPELGAYEVDKPVPHYGPRSPPPGAPSTDVPRSVRGPPQ
jgi:hypothetical protein